jgi:photosynthetic reaction center H subunit
MEGTGSIGGYFDVAQVVLYLFWMFLAGLVYYLHRENKREGYPLDSDRTDRSGGRVLVKGFPAPPPPKTYKLPHGGTYSAPHDRRDTRPIAAEPVAPFPGAPLEPTGSNPMLDGVGPGAYAERADVPDLTYDGQFKIVPMRVDREFSVIKSPDPRGQPVYGADGVKGGTVVDLWVDRSECVLRYLEVETAGSRRVLLPAPFANVSRRQVQVDSILGSQFAQVPALKQPERVTLLEEERICAYYGAGTLYATADRREPLL